MITGPHRHCRVSRSVRQMSLLARSTPCAVHFDADFYYLPGGLGVTDGEKGLRSIAGNDQVMSERGQQAAVVEVAP